MKCMWAIATITILSIGTGVLAAPTDGLPRDTLPSNLQPDRRGDSGRVMPRDRDEDRHGAPELEARDGVPGLKDIAWGYQRIDKIAKPKTLVENSNWIVWTEGKVPYYDRNVLRDQFFSICESTWKQKTTSGKKVTLKFSGCEKREGKHGHETPMYVIRPEEPNKPLKTCKVTYTGEKKEAIVHYEGQNEDERDIIKWGTCT